MHCLHCFLSPALLILGILVGVLIVSNFLEFLVHANYLGHSF